jgi:hypothetical protein
MRNPRFLLVTMLLVVAALRVTGAVTVVEDFSSAPAARGWQSLGNPGLFQWDATNQHLQVTWDSAQPNSYFCRSLGTVLTRSDDFELSFDLRFTDYATGTTPGKPYTFQAAIGFLNLAHATQPNFARGVGINSTNGPRNLVEFDFFPAFSFFLPTVAQTVVSTNNAWQYNHDNLLDLIPGQVFRVVMKYAAATRTLTTTITNNGALYAPAQLISLPLNFDFRLTAVAISSYSDTGADGSILAHGVVDNLRFTVPAPPVTAASGRLQSGVWQMSFTCSTQWFYGLERTTNWLEWTSVSQPVAGTATNLTLSDSNPPPGRAFYRVKAAQP